MAKILTTAILVNLCCLIPASAHTLPELLLLKFLPSTYTITAISWLPLLFHTLAILNRAAIFLIAGLFLSRYHFFLLFNLYFIAGFR